MTALDREIEFWRQEADFAKSRDLAMLAFGAVVALTLFRARQACKSAPSNDDRRDLGSLHALS